MIVPLIKLIMFDQLVAWQHAWESMLFDNRVVLLLQRWTRIMLMRWLDLITIARFGLMTINI